MSDVRAGLSTSPEEVDAIIASVLPTCGSVMRVAAFEGWIESCSSTAKTTFDEYVAP